jgi:hypothetical protein
MPVSETPVLVQPFFQRLPDTLDLKGVIGPAIDIRLCPNIQHREGVPPSKGFHT